jgi:hypothetical protein
MIPFNRQPTEQLKSRYQEAIKSSYDAAAVTHGQAERPGTKPQHVFDFENGIRLIISRDHYKGKEVIHISGSFDSGAYSGSLKRSVIESRMYLCFCEIAGPIKIGRPIYSTGGIPHWFIEHQILN